MRNFSDFIQRHELLDFPLNGAKFTWSNNQTRLVMSRIDPVLSREWKERFPIISQKALPRIESDHNPIILELSSFSRGSCPFRFDLDLLEIPRFAKNVKQWWDEIEIRGWKGYILCQKLKGLKSKIKEWQKTFDDESRQRRDTILATLASLELKEEEGPLLEEDKMLHLNLLDENDTILRREEICWRQISRVLWLQAGDMNSKFFHLTVNSRRRTNLINCLKHGDLVVEDPNLIKSLIVDFYSGLYSRTVEWRPKMEGIQFNRISVAQKANLDREFSEEEVEQAIFSMAGDKAPRPDGYPMGFFSTSGKS
ncbi:uncharacterized protein LOC143852430 [Tasmannia lanceolata]|uniref:uncharacterized protein LOC143852430 n=1 Tax=Tasmannia lanceolata TaxID=3420 RepID=UPI00406290C8